MKNWMSYLKTLRPSALRHDERTATEPAKKAPKYHAPYDAGMSDRFHSPLSTR